jgi:uncharacterized protein involved in exopolysaccharide biosynthesis
LEQSLDESLGASPSTDHPPGSARAASEPPEVEERTAHLVVVGGPETGRLIRLGDSETVLGRGPTATGKLHDPSTSQRHAKVFWHDDGYVLVDLSSTNGTYLNDTRVEGPSLLSHGDRIRLGNTKLRFLAKGRGMRPSETVPLGPSTLAEEPPSRRDLVRYRDARLTPWGPRELAGLGNGGESSSVDWLVYLRKGIEYAKRYAAFLGLLTGVGLVAGATHGVLNPPLGSAYFEISLSRDAKANPVEDERTTPFFVAAERNFRSTGAITETLRRLGIDPTEAKALAIQRRMTFTALDKQERVWRGEYQGASAENARIFLARHLETYLERELDKTLRVLKAQIALLEEQVERSGAELRQTEKFLADFKRAHPGVVGAEGSEQYASLGPLQARRDDLAAQVKRLELEMNLNRQRLNSGDALLQGRVSSASSYTTTLQDIEKQMTEAKAEGLGDDHPKLKRLRGQARELRQLRDSTINAEATDLERRSNEGYVTVRERVRDLEVALRVARTELGQVSERLQQMEGRLSELPETEAQLAKLTRNYASTKALHDRLYQKLRASRIQLQIEQASARARYDLLTPPTPEHPNMTAAVAQRSIIAGMAMFFVALFVAGTREAFRYLRSVL